jgi:DNA (cytosine-5)-methyltransferase 1
VITSLGFLVKIFSIPWLLILRLRKDGPVPHKVIPIIDVFAGPGGLSEGFSRFSEFSRSPISFQTCLAIEKDPVAAKTLTLRSFFRQFEFKRAPEDYYNVIRQKLSISDLKRFPEWDAAQAKVWNVELGAVEECELHSRIRGALKGERDWVLLGGPPCQAYSLMGRARMTGVGAAAREENNDLEKLRQQKRTLFETDNRHELYREYLRIVAVHQPAVFVMENVKGILSSTLPERDGIPRRRVFEQIRQDLSDPWKALNRDPKIETLRSFCKRHPRPYRLYPFVEFGKDAIYDENFLIRSEHYGVPQKRHRVIILGIREDIKATPVPLAKVAPATVRDGIGLLPQLRSGVSKSDTDGAGWRHAVLQCLRKMGGATAGVSKIALERALHPKAQELTRGRGFAVMKLPKPKSRLGVWLQDGRLGGFIQHEARSHMPSDLVRYLFAATTARAKGRSPKLEEWPAALLPLHRNIKVDGTTGIAKTSGFSDRFKVQAWDEAASTITSHISKDGHYYIHPDPAQCRSLTVREAARLQTFPDNYFFCGTRTQQYQQIGNAVPPYLALQLAGVVAKLLAVPSKRAMSGDRRSQPKNAQFQYVPHQIGGHKA